MTTTQDDLVQRLCKVHAKMLALIAGGPLCLEPDEIYLIRDAALSGATELDRLKRRLSLPPPDTKDDDLVQRLREELTWRKAVVRGANVVGKDSLCESLGDAIDRISSLTRERDEARRALEEIAKQKTEEEMSGLTDDLVRRLRKAADTAASGGGEWYQLIHRCREAADRISSLTRYVAECERLKAALSLAEQQRDEARRALQLVDDDVRHHHRSESTDAALLRPHAIKAVRAALKETK